jgi:hypothetical protein
MTFKHILLSGFAVLGCATIATASETGGEPAMLPEEGIALEAAAYARDYGVSEDEAIRRLALMHDAAEEIGSIQAGLGDQLGGIFFDNGADFALTVNAVGEGARVPQSFTSKGRQFERRPLSAKARALGLSEARVDKVRAIAGRPQTGKVRKISRATTGLAKVQAMRQQKARDLTQIPGFNGSSYDERTGEVVVELRSNADREGALQAARRALPGVPVRIEISDEVLTHEHSRGGAKITENGTTSFCTTGFVVRDRTTNAVGVVSAGHCQYTSVRYTAPDGSNYDMDRKQWRMDGTMDLAFFWDDHESVPEFYPTSSATPRTMVGWRSQSETESALTNISGSYLCHYGVRTLTQSCGEVHNKYYQPTIMKNGVDVGCGPSASPYVACGPNFVSIRRQDKEGQVSLHCMPGDSGGPWFAYGNAYGIHKAGSRSVETDPSTCTRAVYTPIIRINDINLTLWYGGTLAAGYAQ